MKSSIKFVVAAFALCFIANASAAVIIQSSTQVNKKQVLVQYRHDGTGVLHTMMIKHKKLAKWCIKRGGCHADLYTPGNSPLVYETVPEQEVVDVPEPATLALMAAGLLGMGIAARRKAQLSA